MQPTRPADGSRRRYGRSRCHSAARPGPPPQRRRRSPGRLVSPRDAAPLGPAARHLNGTVHHGWIDRCVSVIGARSRATCLNEMVKFECTRHSESCDVPQSSVIVDKAPQGDLDRCLDGVGARRSAGSTEEVVVDLYEAFRHRNRLSRMPDEIHLEIAILIRTLHPDTRSSDAVGLVGPRRHDPEIDPPLGIVATPTTARLRSPQSVG